MKNSLEQAEALILGDDQGGRVAEQFARVKSNRPIFEQAYKVSHFFQQGWYKLWRKSLNASGEFLKSTKYQRISRRDTLAFAKLGRLNGWLEVARKGQNEQ